MSAEELKDIIYTDSNRAQLLSSPLYITGKDAGGSQQDLNVGLTIVSLANDDTLAEAWEEAVGGYSISAKSWHASHRMNAILK